jgi:hypothetical protein
MRSRGAAQNGDNFFYYSLIPPRCKRFATGIEKYGECACRRAARPLDAPPFGGEKLAQLVVAPCVILGARSWRKSPYKKFSG